MTLEELENLPSEVLSQKIVESVLHCNPYALNIIARDRGQKGFPYPIIYDGRTLRIPKAGFINYLKGRKDYDKVPIAYDWEFSDTELADIKDYINYVKSKRNKKV